MTACRLIRRSIQQAKSQNVLQQSLKSLTPYQQNITFLYVKDSFKATLSNTLILGMGQNKALIIFALLTNTT